VKTPNDYYNEIVNTMNACIKEHGVYAVAGVYFMLSKGIEHHIKNYIDIAANEKVKDVGAE
jgi:hypothetical protein